MMRRTLLSALPPLLALAACGAPSGGDDTDTTAPAFAEVDAQLKLSCGATSCHGGGSGSLKIDGTEADHERLVDAASAGNPGATLVVPGDSLNSYLVQKMEGASGIVGVQMPVGVSEPDEQVLQLVKDWIEAGALP